MAKPYWLLDTDNPSKTIKFTEIPLSLQIDDVVYNENAPRYSIQCNVCKAHNNENDRVIWPRGTVINGMDGVASNGDSIAFDFQCEQCEQEYSLQVGKQGGLFLKLFRKDIL
jgi:hypothetical protein